MNLPSLEQIQAEMKRRELEKQRELAKLAEEHFSDYIPQAWKVLEPNVPLAPNYHIDAIAEHLEATHIGQIKRLVINIPPRMGKTQFVTIMYPAWRWVKLPSTKYINLSYSASLSVAHNVRRRDLIQSDWYRDNWGNIVSLKDDMNRQNRYENTEGGVMFATSIGGTLTGEGADCFVAGTMIMTENGEIAIEKLCSMENLPRVLSYNHDHDIIEWKEIIMTRRKKSNEIIKVTTTSGREVQSTREHRYYINQRGYRQGNILKRKDEFTVCEIENKQDVRNLWKTKRRKRPNVQRMLCKITSNTRCVEMQKMRSGVYQAKNAIRKVHKKRNRRVFLFERMPGKISKRTERQSLSNLRKLSAKRENLLLGKVQAKSGRIETSRKRQVENVNLRLLRETIQKKSIKSNVLFNGMQRQPSFETNERQSESKLQGWNELQQAVQRRKRLSNKKRRIQMCGMRKTIEIHRCYKVWRNKQANEFNCSSYRQQYSKQFNRQLDNIVPELSCKAPQMQRTKDYVKNVEAIDCGEVDVYDLQVADNHNFFANGILVHNCIIIDDAHNPKQAESDTERQHAIDFFDGTLQTRLNDPINGVIIIVMQRLHERDLTGHVLAKNLGYEHLCLPMEAQKHTVVKLPISGREIVREKGDLLHAERYSQTVIDEMKASMGSYNWAGQMNQTPVPAGGGMFKKWWWQYYQFEGMDLPPIKQTVVSKEIIDGKVVVKTKDIMIHPVTIPSNWAEKKYFEEVSQSWDMAFKSNKDNDFVAGGIWGKKGSGRFMMDLVKRRLSFTETLAEVRKMTAKHPYASRKLVEDKANGPAIIDSLRKEIQGIIPINPGTDSKEARAESTTYMHEAGNVFLPHPMMPGYHWVTDFIENCAKFPKCEHDDDIDQMVQQLNYWKKTNDFLGDAGWY